MNHASPEQAFNQLAVEEKNLLKLFKKDSWRRGQRELVEWVLQGQSCLGVLPTGHGKSLSFQVAALLFGGCSIIISPLIALMQDQVAVLQSLGIAAARFDSSLSLENRDDLLDKLQAGQLKMLYLAPESMDNPALLTILQQIELGLFVVDEAHCVSAWGHSFRPDYLKLPAWSARLPFKALMALTATATPRVREDLKQAFCISDEHCIVLPPYRDNIERQIKLSADKLADLKQFLSHPDRHPAIVYARSRKNVEELAAMLSTKDQTIPCYHAGQNAETRAATQQQFLTNEIPILVATIAFGMGIDKPDVRSVIHYHAPSSPEAYVQESGRAGRDGKPSTSLLLLDHQDGIEIRNRIWAEEPDAEGIARCVRWMVPQSYRVVSNWELGTECDLAADVPQRILDSLQAQVEISAQGYKYYKVRPLFPIATICDGRDEEECARLQWLDAHREGEVEEAAEAWNYSYAEAMLQLQDCEAAQEWGLNFRQQAMQLHRVGEVDSTQLTEQLLDYYAQRRDGSLQRWEQFLTMLSGKACLNEELHHYFMGESGSPCHHCSICAGHAINLNQAQTATQIPDIPPASELPELARDGQRKRFLLGIISPTLMRRRLWAHPHYGCLSGTAWEDL